MENKPHWFQDHEESDQRNFDLIITKLGQMETKLDPVMEAYTTATTIGRWAKTLGAAILLILSIILTTMKIKSGN